MWQQNWTMESFLQHGFWKLPNRINKYMLTFIHEPHISVTENQSLSNGLSYIICRRLDLRISIERCSS